MTDEELNEIFRAIRHRRTLSWATIEKLANEVRSNSRPERCDYCRHPIGAKAARPSTDRWDYYAYVNAPIPAADLSPEAKEFLGRVSANIRRSYEDKVFETWKGKEVTYTNADHGSSDPLLFQAIDPNEMVATLAKHPDVVAKSERFVEMLRQQSAFHKLLGEPIADSPKKE